MIKRANSTQSILNEVQVEMAHAVAKGYTPEHDDEQGVGHLLQETYDRLSDLKGVSEVDQVRVEMIKLVGLLVAGVATIDRSQS